MELAESSRHLHCRYCDTVHFPEPVDADGIRIVGLVANALACPVCKDALHHAVIDTDYDAVFCRGCRGVLLSRPNFATVVNKRRAWATHPPSDPRPIDRRALERKLSCPRCTRRFETYAYYGPGNVVIDNCVSCDLIWLDFGEIRQIVDAPGRDRGTRQLARRDDVPYGPSPSAPADPVAHPLQFLVDLSKTIDVGARPSCRKRAAKVERRGRCRVTLLKSRG